MGAGRLLELIPLSQVRLDGAAARGEVELVALDGDDAANRAYGEDGAVVADGADQVVDGEVQLALPPGGEGSAIFPVDCLLPPHDAVDAGVEDRAAQGRPLADLGVGGEGSYLHFGEIGRKGLDVDRPLQGHCLLVFYYWWVLVQT